MDDIVTTKEAADILGYSRMSVRNLCAWGKLPGAVKMGRDWVIPRATVEGYVKGPQGFAAHPYRGGRKPAKKKEEEE